MSHALTNTYALLNETKQRQSAPSALATETGDKTNKRCFHVMRSFEQHELFYACMALACQSDCYAAAGGLGTMSVQMCIYGCNQSSAAAICGAKIGATTGLAFGCCEFGQLYRDIEVRADEQAAADVVSPSQTTMI